MTTRLTPFGLVVTNDVNREAMLPDGTVLSVTDIAVGGSATTPKALPYTAVGTTSLTIAVIYVVAPTMTAIGTASITKMIQKTLAYVATGTSSIIKQVSKSSGYNATGTASFDEALITEQSASATATGTASSSQTFIAAGISSAGAIVAFVQNIVQNVVKSIVNKIGR